VANILGLFERERLKVAVEIMGHPGDLVRTWFGGLANAVRLLGVYEALAGNRRRGEVRGL
jgi:hypothetical protein